MVILHGPAHPRLNFKKILTMRKHAVRIIFHEEKEAHARPLLKEIYALNVYQINTYKSLHLCKK